MIPVQGQVVTAYKPTLTIETFDSASVQPETNRDVPSGKKLVKSPEPKPDTVQEKQPLIQGSRTGQDVVNQKIELVIEQPKPQVTLPDPEKVSLVAGKSQQVLTNTKLQAPSGSTGVDTDCDIDCETVTTCMCCICHICGCICEVLGDVLSD